MKSFINLLSLCALALSSLVLVQALECVEMSDQDAGQDYWKKVAVQSVDRAATSATRTLIATTDSMKVNVRFRSYYGVVGDVGSRNFTLQQGVSKIRNKDKMGNQQFKWEWTVGAELWNFWLESNDHECQKFYSNSNYTAADVGQVYLYHREAKKTF